MNKDNEIIDIDEVVVSNTKNNILKEMTKPLKYSALPTLTVDDVMKTRSFTLEDLGVGEKRDADWLEQIGIGVGDTMTEIGLLDEQVKMSVGRIYAEPETTRKEAMTRLSTIPVDFPLGNVNYTPISDKPLAQVEELAQTKLTQEQVEEIYNVNNTWGARLMRSAKKNIDNERLGRELSLTHITPDDRQSGLAQASAAISQGIFQAALASIPLVGKVANASYMGASTFGAYTDKSLEQYREKTGDMDLKQFGYNRTDEESMSDVLAGLGYSAISSILTYKLGTERLIWQGAEKLGIKGTAGAIGKIALQEGIEEGLQQAVEYPMRWLAGTNDSTVQEMAQEIITSAVFGAIAGGVVGGGTFRIQKSRLSQLYADKIRELVENNPELKKIFPDEKTIQKTSDSAAEQSLTDAYTGVADEITTVNELQDAFGDSFDYLVSKIETVLNNAGWQQKFPDRDVHEYATVNAQRLAHDVLRQSRLLGVKTSDVLKLSEIDVSDNILHLRPQRLGSVQAIQDTIDEKKKELKDLRRLAKIGGGNPERVSTLNAQIVILQSLLNRRYGIDIQQSSRRIAKQANADQAVIQSVAPATAEELNTIKDATDDESFVYVGNKRVPVVYEVRELSDIIPSHIAGTPNQEYQLKALQNRESRSTQADVAVLRERAGNLHPEELLDAPNTQFGAPIVNERGEIIAGNGRYEVLRTAYQENLSKKGIEKYKKSLKKLGFEIDGFKMPILVRSTSGLTETQQIAVADASNVSITSEFDHASRAKQDAKLLSGANNLLEFAEKIPLTDRQGLFLNNGKWDMVALQRRYDDALMMWLCGNDASLFEDLVLGGGITNKIIQGLVSRGSLLYEFDKQYPEVGLREDIELALRKAPFVKSKVEFANMIAQVEIDGRNVFPENAFLHSFVYAKTATQISEFVEIYTDKSANNIKASETGLFGESAPQFTKYDLLAQTMRESVINQGKFKEDGSTEDGALQAVFLSSQDQFAGQEQISYSELENNEFDIAYENTPIDQKFGYRQRIHIGDRITITITKASAGKNKGKFYANRFNPNGDIEILTEEGWKLHQGGTISSVVAKTFDTIEDLQKAISDTYNVAERAEQYHQGVSKNGFYDSELKTIVLGRNFNLGTLPHELAHFWLDELFLNYKLVSSSSGATPKWVKEVESLFAYLGIDKNQESLTREQHEKFATTMEAVVFGLAKAPDGMQLPITDYMNWIPQKYTSIRAIGYLDKNGIVRNPLLDKNGADFFNAWFSNPSLPALTSSPARDEATNPVKEDGEIIPSTPDVIKQREEQVNSAIAEQEKLDNEIRESLQEELPVEAKSAINAEYTKYDEMSGLKLETLPKDKSWFKQGKRHIREEMAKKAREYVKKNTDHAREVALIGKPALNDTGVDLESLILAVMEYDNVDAKSELGLTYTHNIAMTRSEAGTTLGLHAQDGSYQVYLDGYRRMQASMTETAAYKYAGRGVDSVNKLESDIKALCAKYADAVDNGSMTQERALKALVAEASLKFTGEEDTTILNQIDVKQAGKTRGAFIAYAERLARRVAKTEPNIEMRNKLLDLAPAVQQASIDINSKDLSVSCAAAEKMREWYDLVSSVDVQKTFLSGAINSYAPRAMLSGISTHTTNVISNTIEQWMLRPAIHFHYGKSIIPKKIIEAEKARIKAVYNSTFMNLTTMITPTDPSLIHGEKYKPLDPKATGLRKFFDPMRWLSAEDNLFRNPTYLDVASRMASRDAEGDVEKAIELFKQYTSTQPKKINGEENSMYAKRAELITMSAFATFTQNGKLAGALTKMRNALNSLSVAGYELQLGTIIAPFIKTPANIIASGLRSPFGAGVALVKKIAGKELTFQESVDSAHFIGLALLALLASAFCDYEPPYKGGKYDPNKPYDSIGVGGGWIKLNTFGILEAPMRIWLNVWHNGKFEILETLGNVPLVGELVDNRLSYATNAPVSWVAGTLYNQSMKLIPALIKQLIKPAIKATGAETELEDLDFGIKTGIGRKIERTFGLDGSELSYNDLIAIVFNRLKIY